MVSGFGDGMGSGCFFGRETTADVAEHIQASCQVWAIAVCPDRRSGAGWLVDMVTDPVGVVDLSNQT